MVQYNIFPDHWHKPDLMQGAIGFPQLIPGTTWEADRGSN
jgi:hypothetical protein